MHRAYAPGISDEQIHGRTDVTDGLRPLAEFQRYPSFSDARARIRNFPSAGFGDTPKPLPQPQPRDLDEVRKRADQEAT